MKYKYKISNKFPYINQFLIINEEDLVRPMKWPDEPFVYQYFVFMNDRPLPPHVHTKNWQIITLLIPANQEYQLFIMAKKLD